MVGHRCSVCGLVAFPPDPYGCQNCGASEDALEEVELEAAGSLRAMATVHRHHQDHPATPFTVGIIELVDGPVIKAIVQGEEASVGSRVEGKLVPTEITDNGTQLGDLYFQVVK